MPRKVLWSGLMSVALVSPLCVAVPSSRGTICVRPSGACGPSLLYSSPRRALSSTLLPSHIERTFIQRRRHEPLLCAAAGDAEKAKDGVGERGRRSRPYLVLAALVLLYVNNQWARMLPSYLVSFDEAGRAGRSGRELMNVALGISPAQYGLLVSYGFTLLYVACSFPAGVACDVLPRKIVLLTAATGWSLATAASAAARNYAQLLSARVMLGITQAFSGPAAHTLISATFPPHRRATANAIYSSGIYLGGALASLSVVLSRTLGWRATGFLVAASVIPPALLLMVALRESRQSASPRDVAALPTAQAESPWASIKSVLRVKSVRWLLLGTGTRLFAGFAIGAWSAPYYRSAFPSNAAQYSFINALIVAGAGSLSTVAGGVMADAATNSRSAEAKPHRAALLPIIGSLAAIPFWVAAVRSTSFNLAMAGLLAAYLFAECWYGATIAMLQGALPSTIWGAAQGSLNVVQIFGNLSPLLIGSFVSRGVPLQLLMSWTVPVAYVATAFCFWQAMRARYSESQMK